MNKRILRWLTVVLPVSFFVVMLIGFLGELAVPQFIMVLVFVIIGASIFSAWVFTFIDKRENEIKRRANQLEALNEAAFSLITELDMGVVLQKVVDLSRKLVLSKYGALGVLNEDGDGFEQFITSGITPMERSKIGAPPEGKGLFKLIVREGKSLKLENVLEHEASYGFPPNHPEMRSLLGVPIKTKGEIIGNLYLSEKSDPENPESERFIPFTEDDQMILEMFANQAAIAIENARLYRQIQQLAILEERQRFGMDLHDGVIQSIYAVGLMLEDIQRRVTENPEGAIDGITSAIRSLNTAISDIRNYILELRPQHFQGRDIVQGVQELARALRANTFMDVNVDIRSVDPRRVKPEQAVEILHIAQEALSNVQKHARATDVDITLWFENTKLKLEILDNGISISPEQLQGSNGNGLRNMQERTAVIDGELYIGARENGGTEVRLTVPIN